MPSEAEHGTAFSTKEFIDFSHVASNAQEKVEALGQKVELLEAKLASIDVRLSIIETQLQAMQENWLRISNTLETLAAKSNNYEGFWHGVSLTAKAWGWVAAMMLGAIGSLLVMLIQKS